VGYEVQRRETISGAEVSGLAPSRREPDPLALPLRVDCTGNGRSVLWARLGFLEAGRRLRVLASGRPRKKPEDAGQLAQQSPFEVCG
jgi:hypothetical protein